jgi:alkyl sulfatase BDS1-like metallo-beta-lactamase superfamily hydrolase
VTGVIYTHSHIDHFGGVKGVIDEDDVRSGAVPVLAPRGFTEHAVSENVYAGTAMVRRSSYMYGATLDKGPAAQIGTGLGMTNSLGTVTFIRPTLDITHTGQEVVVDGVRMVFQMTPGTEAPAEMNFFFPDHRVLCLAENATHNMHNLLTPRGAFVRDPRAWSAYLNEAIELFGADTDVQFASHHWPTWGTERVVDFLEKQRDLYGYLHDQTLRLMNQGYVGAEIAEMLELPSSLSHQWHCRGYYGSFNFNVKAVYQRYMGWFDGNPAHLWPHPPEESAMRYVEFMGGADAVVEKSRVAYDAGDYRWVAQVLDHVVFADPGHVAARQLEADALEQLGYQSENGPWRNFYLMGARELRQGITGGAAAASSDVMHALTVEQILDSLAIRIDGPRAAEAVLRFSLELTDENRAIAVTLRHGVLTYVSGKRLVDAQLAIRISGTDLVKMLVRSVDRETLLAEGRLELDGDPLVIVRLLELLDRPDPGFAIVTP